MDWLFFRRRYNTEQAIAEFGAVMRREVDFDKLNHQLLALVQDSVQPQHVSLWTRPAYARTAKEPGRTPDQT